MDFKKCNRKEGLDKAVCEAKIIAEDKYVRKSAAFVSRVVLAGVVIANPHLAPIQSILK